MPEFLILCTTGSDIVLLSHDIINAINNMELLFHKPDCFLVDLLTCSPAHGTHTVLGPYVYVVDDGGGAGVLVVVVVVGGGVVVVAVVVAHLACRFPLSCMFRFTTSSP